MRPANSTVSECVAVQARTLVEDRQVPVIRADLVCRQSEAIVADDHHLDDAPCVHFPHDRRHVTAFVDRRHLSVHPTLELALPLVYDRRWHDNQAAAPIVGSTAHAVAGHAGLLEHGREEVDAHARLAKAL